MYKGIFAIPRIDLVINDHISGNLAASSGTINTASTCCRKIHFRNCIVLYDIANDYGFNITIAVNACTIAPIKGIVLNYVIKDSYGKRCSTAGSAVYTSSILVTPPALYDKSINCNIRIDNGDNG